MSFDARTIALLVVFAFFVQTIAIGAQAFIIREYRGIKLALLGNLSLALGFLLVTFRGSLPDFVSIVVGNTLIILGPGLFYIAISLFTNQKFNARLIATGVGVTTAALIFFRYSVDNIALRIITISIAGAISQWLIIFKLWQARQNTAYRFSLRLTLFAFTVYGIFLIVRIIATILAPPQTIFVNTPLEAATYLLLFLVSFLWTIGFVLMVSQRLQADLRELATIDALTRIPNRRAAQMFLEKEISRASRKHEPFSILLIDVDNFKQINDKHGHAMGDHVLIKSADLFQENIRKQDLVGRWGGEEFLIVLSGSSMENAKCLAERLRVQIENTKYDNNNTPTTISIGISTSKGTDPIEKILKAADDALYVAKATKNAVVTAHAPEAFHN